MPTSLSEHDAFAFGPGSERKSSAASFTEYVRHVTASNERCYRLAGHGNSTNPSSSVPRSFARPMPPQKIHASKKQYKTDVSNLAYQSDTPLFRTRFSAALHFEDWRESVESLAAKRRNDRELPFAGTPRTPVWNEKELLRSKEGAKDKKNHKKTGWCADAAIEQERQLWGERGRNKHGRVYRMLGQSVEDQEGKVYGDIGFSS